MKQSLHIQSLLLQSLQQSTPTGSIRGIKSTEIDSKGTLRYKVLRDQSTEQNKRQTLVQTLKIMRKNHKSMRKTSRSVSKLNKDEAWLNMEFPCVFLAHILAVLYGVTTLHKTSCVFETVQIKKKKNPANMQT